WLRRRADIAVTAEVDRADRGWQRRSRGRVLTTRAVAGQIRLRLREAAADARRIEVRVVVHIPADEAVVGVEEGALATLARINEEGVGCATAARDQIELVALPHVDISLAVGVLIRQKRLDRVEEDGAVVGDVAAVARVE